MTDIPPPLPETSIEEAREAIKRVAAKKNEWAALSAAAKLGFIREMIENLKLNMHLWADTACVGHEYDAKNPAHGHLLAEMYLLGPSVCGHWLRGLEGLYASLAATGKPTALGAAQKRSDGSFAVKTWPLNTVDTVFSGGASGILYTNEQPSQFNPLELPGSVAGLLGAGNFDAPTDILSYLFLENKVVIFKPNPVNQRAAVVIKRVFEPLIKAGYLDFVVGGIPLGAELTKNPLIEELCMTGSCVTYDAIVWGPGAAKPKPGDPESESKKLVKKPFKAELGSVSPYVIVPGKWSEKELNAHAEQLVAFKMLNNGHICASPQVVITCKNWSQREQFIAAVRKNLARHPPTRPYYPNCQRSYAEQVKNLAKDTGADEKGDGLIIKNEAGFPEQQHPVFAAGVPQDAFVTQKEAFCPILAEVPLDTAATTEAFLPKAVDYVNNKLWGSLSGTVIINSEAEKAAPAVVEKALDDLKLGAIGVNQWAGMVNFYPGLLWGAYPRHTPEDVQSGIGINGNVHCLKDPYKCVLRFPFSHPGMPSVPAPAASLLQARRVTEFTVHYNFWRLAKLLVNVLTGY